MPKPILVESVLTCDRNLNVSSKNRLVHCSHAKLLDICNRQVLFGGSVLICTVRTFHSRGTLSSCPHQVGDSGLQHSEALCVFHYNGY